MFDLAIILYTLRRFGSPALTGWVAFAAFGPGLIASPFAGALLDRLRAPLAIIVDMLITASLVLALIFLEQAEQIGFGVAHRPCHDVLADQSAERIRDTRLDPATGP